MFYDAKALNLNKTVDIAYENVNSYFSEVGFKASLGSSLDIINSATFPTSRSVFLMVGCDLKVGCGPDTIDHGFQCYIINDSIRQNLQLGLFNLLLVICKGK